VWDFRHRQEEVAFRGPHTPGAHGWDVKTVQWHPFMSLLASGSKDNLIKLCAAGRALARALAHPRTHSPARPRARRWDVQAGKCIRTIHDHKNTVSRVRWNKNVRGEGGGVCVASAGAGADARARARRASGSCLRRATT
jgi:polyadenylation factor subunit 2